MPYPVAASRGRILIAPHWILLDEFTTAEGAPLTSPRATEPGPGMAVVVDAATGVSITGGKCRVVPAAAGWNYGMRSVDTFDQADLVSTTCDVIIPASGRLFVVGFSNPSPASLIDVAYGLGMSDEVSNQFAFYAAIDGIFTFIVRDLVVAGETIRAGVFQIQSGAIIAFQGGAIANSFGCTIGSGRWYPLGEIANIVDGVSSQFAAARVGIAHDFDNWFVQRNLSYGPMRHIERQASIGVHIPWLIVAANGDLLLTYQVGVAGHITTANVVKLTRSTNAGASWSVPATIISAPGGSNSLQTGGTMLRSNGDIWHFQMVLANLNEYESTLSFRISADHGATWGSPQALTGLPDSNYMAFNSALELSTGRIVIPAHRRPTASAVFSRHLLYSDDGGASWAKIDLPNSAGAAGGTDTLTETAFAVEADGTYVQFIRKQSGTKIYLSESDDFATWSTPVATNVDDPGSRIVAQRLIDGRMAVMHNNDDARRRNCRIFTYAVRSGATLTIDSTYDVGSYDPNDVGAGDIQYPALLVSGSTVHMAWSFQKSSYSEMLYDNTPLGSL